MSHQKACSLEPLLNTPNHHRSLHNKEVLSTFAAAKSTGKEGLILFFSSFY